MNDDWVLEFRQKEIWAWACGEQLFLRLHRCGLGAISELSTERAIGEFRWQTLDAPLDFDQINGASLVALLEVQLADTSSDLSLARHYADLDSKQRAWQQVAFGRGTRADFEMALRLVASQEPTTQTLTASDISCFSFGINEYEILSWNFRIGNKFSGGRVQVSQLHARFAHLVGFFAPHRDTTPQGRKRARVDSLLLFESNFPLRFSIPLPTQPLTGHEMLENLQTLRALFARYLAPAEATALLGQISSFR